ncbi:MAG: hypothetical protein QXF35_03790 [Candidatus Bilamarchaeaceae archaeon]
MLSVFKKNDNPIALFNRKPIIKYPKKIINYNEFKEIFEDLIKKCNIEKKVGEEELLKVASTAGKIFRSDCKVYIKIEEKNITIPAHHLILTKLWIKALSAFTTINEEEMTARYISNGGNIAFKEIVEPICCFNFFPNSNLAREHNRFFKNFLDTIPSEKFLDEFYKTPSIGSLTNEKIAQMKEIIEKKQNIINYRASYNYQRYATGIENETFRFLANLEENGKKFSIKRLLLWEPFVINKIEKLKEAGFSTQEVVSILHTKKSNFTILSEKGETISKMIKELEEEILNDIFYELGVILRKMHEKGIGHDSPLEMLIYKDENEKAKIMIGSLEDVWFNDKEEPLPYSDRVDGLERVLTTLTEKCKNNFEKYFIDGYGAQEIEKIKKSKER